MGNDEYGYPPSLLPNLAYSPNTSTSAADAFFGEQKLDPTKMLLLGPLIVNESYVLFSATLAVVNNTAHNDVLGWLTMVIDATMILDIQNSPEGLGRTGEVLLVGPPTSNNQYPSNPRNASADFIRTREGRFVLPLSNSRGRHVRRSSSTTTMIPFSLDSFQAVVSAWTKPNGGPNNAGAYIATKNEEGQKVSTGYRSSSWTGSSSSNNLTKRSSHPSII